MRRERRTAVSRQIQRGLHKSMHRLRLRIAVAGRAPRVSFRSRPRPRCDSSPDLPGRLVPRDVGHAQGDVAGGKVERDVAILEVEGGGAILVVQHALLDHNAAGLQIEELSSAGLPCFLGLRGCGWLVEPSG